ncbi:MAG: SLC13 family permease [Acidimicrobiales bacterium]
MGVGQSHRGRRVPGLRARTPGSLGRHGSERAPLSAGEASLALLGLAVVGAVLRPRGLPASAAPTVAVMVSLLSGLIGPHEAAASLRPLYAPIAFLLAAVPLAVLLDRLGFFEAVAAVFGRGPHLVGWLWVLAAAVATVLNLDAAVVLLTPLYVGIARRLGLDVRSLAYQPILLALLASSALPVSNLTNLIVAERLGLGSAEFLLHLGPPSVVAVVVGWFAYRRLFGPGLGHPAPPGAPALPDRPNVGALVVGGAVVGAVLVGFIAGPGAGLDPWAVALAGDGLLLISAGFAAGLGSRFAGGLPTGSVSPRPAAVRTGTWRASGALLRAALAALPWGTAMLAGSLGILAPAALHALPHGVVRAAVGSGPVVRTAAVSAAAANAVNNLPALLLAMPVLGRHATPRLWGLLLGLNMGPVLLITGSLASLLWLEAARALGVPVSGGDFTRVGLRVGLPALLAALGCLVALGPLVG